MIEAMQRSGLGAIISDARRRAGLTQEQLAAKAGIGANHLSRIEREECDPLFGTVAALASALGTSVSRLTKGVATVVSD